MKQCILACCLSMFMPASLSASPLAVAGTWGAADSKATLTFYEPSMYKLDSDGDARADIEGTVLVEGATIVFRAMSVTGKTFAGCAGSYGVYAFEKGQSLKLTPLKEPCAARQQALAKQWSAR